MDMHSFQHITPPLRLYHGDDSLSHLGRELDRMKCRRAAIICGPWLEQAGLLDRTRAALGDRFAGIYSDVVGHSPVDSVQDAADLLTRLEADVVIAIGGGSSIVTARAASILAAEKQPVSALCTTFDEGGKAISPKLLAPKLPQLIIPTTPTTAIVKAGSAVFDPASGSRLALFDPKTRAQAVFIDPQMILSAPRGLVASACINTMSMAIEGLSSRSGNPLADALLMHVLRLCATHLPDTSRHDDPAVRGDLVMAAVMCGQGTDHTAAGVTTVLGHAIGARFEKENGLINAIVLPHVLRFNGNSNSAGLTKVATAFGLQGSPDVMLQGTIEKVERIFAALGVPTRLRDLDIPQAELGEVAALGMKDWFLKGNPRPVKSAEELQHILEEAW